MSVVLASTWRPRGEMPRFQRLYARLMEVYDSLIIAVPFDIDPADLEEVNGLHRLDGVRIAIPPDRTRARYAAMRASLDTSAGHIHYVDMDRLLRWVETRPEELRQTVQAVVRADCLIIGRSAAALQTHPRSLQKTEAIVNAVFSHLLGQSVDLCSGSKGFSRRAAHFLIHNSSPGNWSNAEWPTLLHQAGFALRSVLVDGLDWESADRHRLQAADAESQRLLADEHDRDVEHWEFRVQAALDIVREGLAAARRSA